MKWFKHDSDANMDAKLKRVRAKYGMEGYGLYWYCLELIAQTVEKHNLTFELEHDAELIAIDTNIHPERIQEIMLDFVKWQLFENSHGVITCLKMASRTDEYTQQLMRNQESLGTNSRVSRNNIRGNRTEQNRTEQKNTNIETSVSICPVTEIVNLYHQNLPTLPKVAKLTKTRIGYIKQRWREDMPSLQQWENFFNFVNQSDFLMGRTAAHEDRPPFRADFEWLIKPSNFTKIAERRYHRV